MRYTIQQATIHVHHVLSYCKGIYVTGSPTVRARDLTYQCSQSTVSVSASSNQFPSGVPGYPLPMQPILHSPMLSKCRLGLGSSKVAQAYQQLSDFLTSRISIESACYYMGSTSQGTSASPPSIRVALSPLVRIT